MADELPIEKISISGPTLASIIQRFASSPGDVDGLLFGHLTRLPPPDLHDDDGGDPASSSAVPSLAAATIAGFFCSGSPMSFYDALGRVDHRSLLRHRPTNFPLIGWFSGRRRTALRPSMREVAVSFSLSKTSAQEEDQEGRGSPHPGGSPDLPPSAPRIFLLLSSSSTANQAVHTHDYRAFVFRPNESTAGVLEPRSLDVINVGPAFRGQYSSFSPQLSFPWMPCETSRGPNGEGEGDSEAINRGSSLNGLRKPAVEQQVLESSVEGFGLERLERLVGPGAAEYTAELEDLYRKMLLKLEGLARLVEKSSARVLEQENQNLLLRTKIAGLE